MKITASYGSRSNDENYFVSFETQYDVLMKDAPAAINEMFQLAKNAIQGQAGHSYFPKEEEKEDLFENSNEILTNGDGKITAKQIKFIYQLLKNSKKFFGNDATDFLKQEFQVRTVKDIPFKQADAFIKKLLKEAVK